MFTQIAILGAGLLGASVMRTVRARRLAGRIVAWSRSAETRDFCSGKPWCDAVFETPEACVREADLIIACVPPDKIVATLAGIAHALKPGAIVTDVGSTKGKICRRADETFQAFPDIFFVGSHPMAGSEKSGPEHATPALFDGRICFVTPTEKSSPPAVEKLCRFWSALGMRTVPSATPELHDKIVAHTSHLPHLIASTLAEMLATKPENWRTLAGPGLRDTTRVAAGDPTMWRGILYENREEISAALRDYQSWLNRLEKSISGGDFASVEKTLEAAKHWREGFPPL